MPIENGNEYSIEEKSFDRMEPSSRRYDWEWLIPEDSLSGKIRYPEKRTDGPGWEFRVAPEWFEPIQDRVVVFNPLGWGYKGYLEMVDYEKVSEDPENFNRCMSRERAIEVAACREYGIPYYFIIDVKDKNNRIRVSGLGDALTSFSKYLVVDSQFRPVELTGKTIFLRTHAQDGENVMDALGEFWAKRIMPDIIIRRAVKNWFNSVKPEFLWRKVHKFKLWDLMGEDGEYSQAKEIELLREFTDLNWNVFVKTSDKYTSSLKNIHSSSIGVMYDVFGYSLETMGLGTEFLVSEPMKLSKDGNGKSKEYRCYVVNGRLVSISRYHDYETLEIPEWIKWFGSAFVEEHSDIFGDDASYVVDLCECDDNRIRVVEMNSIEWSGRYEGNFADAMLLSFASNGKISFEV